MKVLLYFEKQNAMKQSGIGRALSHQKQALELNNIEYTLDPKNTYDIAHINTLFSDSYRILKKCKKKKKSCSQGVELVKENDKCVALIKAERSWTSDMEMQSLEFAQLIFFGLALVQYYLTMMFWNNNCTCYSWLST